MSTSNGQRQSEPELIADNTSDSIEPPRSPRRTSVSGAAGHNGDAEKSAPIQNVSTPSVPARTLGSTDSRSSDMLGPDGPGDYGVGEGAERAVLLATKLHVPAIGEELVHRAALLDAVLTDWRPPTVDALQSRDTDRCSMLDVHSWFRPTKFWAFNSSTATSMKRSIQ